MATYAIGDVQGCYEPLRCLLDSIAFDPTHDMLWFAGDVVNRGLQSLESLRYVKNLGRAAVTILGNHDLHLLVVAAGYSKKQRGDTLEAILRAPDREDLLHWLRQQPLMHADDALGFAMVHAGLLPQWSIAQALALAGEVEQVMRAGDHDELMRNMYGNEPRAWHDSLQGYDRLRAIINAMTRMRLCSAQGEMEFRHKLAPAPGTMPDGFMPWYDVPGRASAGTPIVFGHWASLGVLLRDDVIGLDSGCVWGRELTAMRLEDRRLFQCSCNSIKNPAFGE